MAQPRFWRIVRKVLPDPVPVQGVVVYHQHPGDVGVQASIKRTERTGDCRQRGKGT